MLRLLGGNLTEPRSNLLEDRMTTCVTPLTRPHMRRMGMRRLLGDRFLARELILISRRLVGDRQQRGSMVLGVRNSSITADTQTTFPPAIPLLSENALRLSITKQLPATPLLSGSALRR